MSINGSISARIMIKKTGLFPFRIYKINNFTCPDSNYSSKWEFYNVFRTKTNKINKLKKKELIID
jgi:hypothetical protein